VPRRSGFGVLSPSPASLLRLRWSSHWTGRRRCPSCSDVFQSSAKTSAIEAARPAMATERRSRNGAALGREADTDSFLVSMQSPCPISAQHTPALLVLGRREARNRFTAARDAIRQSSGHRRIIAQSSKLHNSARRLTASSTSSSLSGVSNKSCSAASRKPGQSTLQDCSRWLPTRHSLARSSSVSR